jgi:hypothetical protein
MEPAPPKAVLAPQHIWELSFAWFPVQPGTGWVVSLPILLPLEALLPL